MRKIKNVNMSNSKKRPMGQIAAEIRDSIGLSQEEFGSRMGKSQQTVSRLEQKKEFTEEEFQDVLESLEVTRDFFERWQGNPRSFTINNYQNHGQGGYVNNNFVNPMEELLKQFEELKAVYKEQIEFFKELLKGKDADIAALQARIDKLETLIIEKDQQIKDLLAKLNNTK